MTTVRAATETRTAQPRSNRVQFAGEEFPRSHRCRGLRCSTCDSDADLGVGLTDLELDDDVYCSDSEFDDTPLQSPVSSWYRTRRPTTAGKVTVSRRDSGVGSITHDDVCEQELYGSIDEPGVERVLPPVGLLYGYENTVSVNESCRRRSVPRMGTKMLQRRSPCVGIDLPNRATTEFSCIPSIPSSFTGDETTPRRVDSVVASVNDRVSPSARRHVENSNSLYSNTQSSKTDDVVSESRWIVRRRSDGSRYITRRPSATENDAAHPRNRRRRHRLPSNDDMISQWRRLAFQLARREASLCDENVSLGDQFEVSRLVAVEVL